MSRTRWRKKRREERSSLTDGREKGKSVLKDVFRRKMQFCSKTPRKKETRRRSGRGDDHHFRLEKDALTCQQENRGAVFPVLSWGGTVSDQKNSLSGGKRVGLSSVRPKGKKKSLDPFKKKKKAGGGGNRNQETTSDDAEKGGEDISVQHKGGIYQAPLGSLQRGVGKGGATQQ